MTLLKSIIKIFYLQMATTVANDIRVFFEENKLDEEQIYSNDSPIYGNQVSGMQFKRLSRFNIPMTEKQKGLVVNQPIYNTGDCPYNPSVFYNSSSQELKQVAQFLISNYKSEAKLNFTKNMFKMQNRQQTWIFMPQKNMVTKKKKKYQLVYVFFQNHYVVSQTKQSQPKIITKITKTYTNKAFIKQKLAPNVSLSQINLLITDSNNNYIAALGSNKTFFQGISYHSLSGTYTLWQSGCFMNINSFAQFLFMGAIDYLSPPILLKNVVNLQDYYGFKINIQNFYGITPRNIIQQMQYFLQQAQKFDQALQNGDVLFDQWGQKIIQAPNQQELQEQVQMLQQQIKQQKAKQIQATLNQIDTNGVFSTIQSSVTAQRIDSFQTYSNRLAVVSQKLDIYVKTISANNQSDKLGLTILIQVFQKNAMQFQQNPTKQLTEKLLQNFNTLQSLIQPYLKLEFDQLRQNAKFIDKLIQNRTQVINQVYPSTQQEPQDVQEHTFQGSNNTTFSIQNPRNMQVTEIQQVKQIITQSQIKQQIAQITQTSNAMMRTSIQQLQMLKNNQNCQGQNVSTIAAAKYNKILSLASNTIDLKVKVLRLKKNKYLHIKKKRYLTKINTLFGKLGNLQNFFKIYAQIISDSFGIPKNTFDNLALNFAMSGITKDNFITAKVYKQPDQVNLQNNQIIQEYMTTKDYKETIKSISDLMQMTSRTTNQVLRNQIQQSFRNSQQTFYSIMNSLRNHANKSINLSKLIRLQAQSHARKSQKGINGIKTAISALKQSTGNKVKQLMSYLNQNQISNKNQFQYFKQSLQQIIANQKILISRGQLMRSVSDVSSKMNVIQSQYLTQIKQVFDISKNQMKGIISKIDDYKNNMQDVLIRQDTSITNQISSIQKAVQYYNNQLNISTQENLRKKQQILNQIIDLKKSFNDFREQQNRYNVNMQNNFNQMSFQQQQNFASTNQSFQRIQNNLNNLSNQLTKNSQRWINQQRNTQQRAVQLFKQQLQVFRKQLKISISRSNYKQIAIIQKYIQSMQNNQNQAIQLIMQKNFDRDTLIRSIQQEIKKTGINYTQLYEKIKDLDQRSVAHSIGLQSVMDSVQGFHSTLKSAMLDEKQEQKKFSQMFRKSNQQIMNQFNTVQQMIATNSGAQRDFFLQIQKSQISTLQSLGILYQHDIQTSRLIQDTIVRAVNHIQEKLQQGQIQQIKAIQTNSNLLREALMQNQNRTQLGLQGIFNRLMIMNNEGINMQMKNFQGIQNHFFQLTNQMNAKNNQVLKRLQQNSYQAQKISKSIVQSSQNFNQIVKKQFQELQLANQKIHVTMLQGQQIKSYFSNVVERITKILNLPSTNNPQDFIKQVQQKMDKNKYQKQEQQSIVNQIKGIFQQNNIIIPQRGSWGLALQKLLSQNTTNKTIVSKEKQITQRQLKQKTHAVMQLSTKIKTLETQINIYKNSISTANQQKIKLQTQKSQAQQRIIDEKNTAQRIQSIQKNSDAQTIASLNHKIQQLSTQNTKLKSYQQQLAKKQGQNSGNAVVLNNLNSQLRQKQNNLSQLKRQYDLKINDLQTRLRTSQQQSKQYAQKGQLNSQNQNQIGTLKKQIDQISRKKKKIEDQYFELGKKTSTMQGNLSSAKSKISQIQNSLSLSAQRVKTLEEQITQIRTQKNTFQSESGSLRARVQQLQKQVGIKQTQQKNIKQKVQTLSTFQQKLKKSSQRVAQLEQEVKSMSKIKQDLRLAKQKISSLQTVETDLASVKKSKQILISKVGQLQQIIANNQVSSMQTMKMKTRLQVIEEQNTTQKKIVKQLKQTLSQKQLTLQRLQMSDITKDNVLSEKNALLNELGQQKKKVRAALQLKQIAQESLKKALKKYQQQQKQTQNLTQKLNKLKKKVEDLEEQSLKAEKDKKVATTNFLAQKQAAERRIRQFNQLKVHLESIQRTNQQLNQSLTKAQSDLSFAVQQKGRISQQLHNSNTIKSKTQSQRISGEAARGQVARLGQIIKAKDSQIKQHLRKIKQFERKVQQAEERIVQIEGQLQQQTKKFNKKQSDIKTLNKQIKTLKAQRQAKKQQLQGIQQELKQQKGKAQDLQLRLKGIRTQTVTKIAHSQLQKLNSTLSQQLNTISGKYQSLQTQILKANQEIHQKQEQIKLKQNTLTQTISRINIKNQQQKRSLETILEQVRKQKLDLAKQHSLKQQTYNTRIRQIQARENKANQTITTLRTQKNTIQATLVDLKGKLQGHQAKMQQLTSIKKQLQKKQQEIQNLQSAKQANEKYSATLKQIIFLLSQKAPSILTQKNMNEAILLLKESISQNARRSSRIQALTIQKNGIIQTLDLLKQNASKNQAKNRQYIQTIDRQLKQIKDSLKIQNLEIKSLTDVRNIYQKLLKQNIQEIQQLNAKYAQLENRFDKLQKQSQQKIKQISLLQVKVQQGNIAQLQLQAKLKVIQQLQVKVKSQSSNWATIKKLQNQKQQLKKIQLQYNQSQIYIKKYYQLMKIAAQTLDQQTKALLAEIQTLMTSNGKQETINTKILQLRAFNQERKRLGQKKVVQPQTVQVISKPIEIPVLFQKPKQLSLEQQQDKKKIEQKIKILESRVKQQQTFIALLLGIITDVMVAIQALSLQIKQSMRQLKKFQKTLGADKKVQKIVIQGALQVYQGIQQVFKLISNRTNLTKHQTYTKMVISKSQLIKQIQKHRYFSIFQRAYANINK